MKRIFVLAAAAALFITGNALIASGMNQGQGGNGAAMEGMNHGSSTMDGTFMHNEMAGDVHAEFQIMELASMNMTDPEGKTHHVMVKFKRDGKVLENIVGKVKLVSPSGKELIAALKDYGSGVYAANFTIDEPGKWGVICLFKDDQGTNNVKFWYQHSAM